MPQSVLETDILFELVSKKELAFYRHDEGIWQYIDSERDQATLCNILNK
jgi:hypothetical protein